MSVSRLILHVWGWIAASVSVGSCVGLLVLGSWAFSGDASPRLVQHGVDGEGPSRPLRVGVDAEDDIRAYRNSRGHEVFEIDLDLDGQPDKVVSSARNMGNELIFFMREGDTHRKVLRSVNLSQDGGRIFGGIDPVAPDLGKREVFTITNVFPKGEDVAIHYVSHGDKGWVLSRTIYEIADWRSGGSRYRCEVLQGIPMQELALVWGAGKVLALPEAEVRNDLCEKL